MAYEINKKCTMCSACLSECPVNAISEGNPIYKIDPELCIDCGICEGVCPESAIAPGK